MGARSNRNACMFHVKWAAISHVMPWCFGYNTKAFLWFVRIFQAVFARYLTFYSEAVDKEFTESEVLDAFIVAADDERSHGDDILLVVVLDFLQTAELALAGLV